LNPGSLASLVPVAKRTLRSVVCALPSFPINRIFFFIARCWSEESYSHLTVLSGLASAAAPATFRFYYTFTIFFSGRHFFSHPLGTRSFTKLVKIVVLSFLLWSSCKFLIDLFLFLLFIRSIFSVFYFYFISLSPLNFFHPNTPHNSRL
jgi:hypothetical protein